MVNPLCDVDAKLIVITDNKSRASALQELFRETQVCSYTQLMRAGQSLPAQLEKADMLWFDLPEGHHLKATKVGAIEQLLKDVIVDCRHLSILTMLPFVKPNVLSLIHI